MKKINVLRLVLSVTLAAFLLCGCGNSKEAPAEDAPEVAAEEEVTEENEVEEEEEQQSVEEETSAGEEGAEEPKEEETSTDMPEAQVTTTVADITEFLDYAESLKEPAILIYNEKEGYVIKMGEGEYYQLKNEDRIFEKCPMEAVKRSVSYIENSTLQNIRGTIDERTYDYSKLESPQKINFVVFFTENEYDGDYFLLTYYLDAPAE